MDHFQLYLTPQLQKLQVPALFTKKIVYDQQGFYGFPARMGIEPSVLWSRRASCNANMSDRDVMCLLQNWLYFAFAHEVMGRIISDTPMPLTTNHLVNLETCMLDSQLLIIGVVAWMAVQERSPKHVQQERAKQILALINDVRNTVRAIFSAEDAGEISYTQHSDVVPTAYRIIIAILLLGEQIDAAMEVIYGGFYVPRVAPSFSVEWPLSDRLLRIYSELGGCCQHELRMLMRTEKAPNTMLMWNVVMSSIVPQQNHGACLETECIAIGEIGCLVAHVEENCTCCDTCLSADNYNELVRCIEQGQIPMLIVETIPKTTDATRIQLSIFDKGSNDQACFAISHVWSDGLGNPASNTMPACQLIQLQKIASDAAVWMGISLRKVGFWIDTICVPVDDRLKKLALTNMAAVYRDATAVVVLDRNVMKTSPEDGWLAVMWAIYTSQWYRRLWTLQEGTLNKATLFLVLEDFWTIEYLINAYDRCEALTKPLEGYRKYLGARRGSRLDKLTDMLRLRFGQTVVGFENPKTPALLDPLYTILRYRLSETRSLYWTSEGRIGRLLRELAWRDTSHREDESICLAILTGMDVKKLNGRSRDENLAIVVDNMGAIPAELVFDMDPKLDLTGHRWMPRTLLNTKAFAGDYSWRPGRPTADGLLIDLPYLRAKGKWIQFLATMGRASNAKLQLAVGSEDVCVVACDTRNQPFRAFFGGGDVSSGGHEGVILLSSEFRKNASFYGYIATTQRVENNVWFVTLVTPCAVFRPEMISSTRERRNWSGFVEDEDLTLPLLNQHAAFAPGLKSEAEYVASQRFCIA